MGVPTPATSPWTQEFGDNDDLFIRISVEFNEATRALTRITMFRDVGCRWDRILIGLGADGIPDSTDKVIRVDEGTTVLSSTEMRRLRTAGLSTIEDIEALQITATRPPSAR